MNSNLSSLATSENAPSARILLVDDHADLLSMLELVMQRRDYQVATAQSAAQALQVAPSFAPSLIVSDIGMPEMNGYELMCALRDLDGVAPFKSIALTGYDEPDEAARARSAGFDAQLTKPVDFDQLFDLIEKLLA